MGTCSSSLFANKAALMLSIEAVSILKKVRDLSAPFDRKRLRAAIFLLRLCTSLSVFGCSTSVMAFTIEGLARIPCLASKKHFGQNFERDSTFQSISDGKVVLISQLLQSGFLIGGRRVVLPVVSSEWQYLDMSRDRLLPNIRGGCSKLLAAFFVAMISLGLLDRLESSSWLGPWLIRGETHIHALLSHAVIVPEDFLFFQQFSLSIIRSYVEKEKGLISFTAF
ncbi:hypothetical protein Tco_0667347 [Tanacetum coccineum]